MSEFTPEEPGLEETGAETAAEPVPPATLSQEFREPTRTGVEEVDEVLASVQDLDDTPVDEHVAVFENAHERLRGALDGRADA